MPPDGQIWDKCISGKLLQCEQQRNAQMIRFQSVSITHVLDILVSETMFHVWGGTNWILMLHWNTWILYLQRRMMSTSTSSSTVIKDGKKITTKTVTTTGFSFPWWNDIRITTHGHMNVPGIVQTIVLHLIQFYNPHICDKNADSISTSMVHLQMLMVRRKWRLSWRRKRMEVDMTCSKTGSGESLNWKLSSKSWHCWSGSWKSEDIQVREVRRREKGRKQRSSSFQSSLPALNKLHVSSVLKS